VAAVEIGVATDTRATDNSSVKSVRGEDLDVNEEVYDIKFDRPPLQDEIESTKAEMIRNIRGHGKKGKKSTEYNADSPTLNAALASTDTD
jgi:hypothetical protein